MKQYTCAWGDCSGASWICCWEATVTAARAAQSLRGRIFHIDGGAESGRSIGRAQTFYTMVKCVCAFGGASLVRIHEHGATARLCCVCGDGEATVTAAWAAQSWHGRIFHIDCGAESGRSIGRARTFYTMVKCVCAFGGASLVRIHEHGATARLCVVCGDGEATVTGVKASHSWRGQIFHIDGEAENGRSIGRARTFYTMVKGVCAFGGASLVCIHDHGATAQLCCGMADHVFWCEDDLCGLFCLQHLLSSDV